MQLASGARCQRIGRPAACRGPTQALPRLQQRLQRAPMQVAAAAPRTSTSELEQPLQSSSSSSSSSEQQQQPQQHLQGQAPQPPEQQQQQQRRRRRSSWSWPWPGRPAAAADAEADGGDGDPRGRRRQGRPWRLDGRALLSQLRLLLLCVAGALLLFMARQTAALQARAAPREVLYSEFVTLLDAGAVRAARLEAAASKLFFDMHPGGGSTPAAAAVQPAAASGKAAKAAAKTAAAVAAAAAGAAAPTAVATVGARPQPLARRFFVKLADKQDAALTARILNAGVEFGVVRASFGAQLQHMVLTVLALWIPLLPLLFLAQRLVESRSGNKRRKPGGTNAPRITFADVAGVSSAKEELREVVACLRNAGQYSRVRARMPSGVLLSGPPGTGKTLLAKAVAGEAGVPFLSVAASEFVELFVGRGAARVRELFAEARKAAPCVVFIDELDAIGGRRGSGFNDERDQTLNQLLTELDGFEGRPGVLLLAATNRADALDPALLRPGRISRRVVVPLPDEAGRAAILGVHLRPVEVEGGEGAKAELARQLAAITPGFSGAELANVVNEGLLLLARRNGEVLGLAELLQGISRTRYGIDGGRGNGGPRDALGRKLGRWLMRLAAPQAGKQVKVASS